MPRKQVILICVLIFLSLATVFITTPKEQDFASYADEGYYFRYSQQVASHGISQFRLFLKQHIESQYVRLYPTPSRIGHIILAALWFKIFGATFISLAHFSLFCFIVFLISCFYYAKKFFGIKIALFFVLLLSYSPIMMALAKRALGDSDANLFLALSFWAFMDYLSDQRLRKLGIFIVVFTVSILVKETSLAFIIFIYIFSLIHKNYFRRPLNTTYLWLSVSVPIILAVSGMIIAFGSFDNFFLMIYSVLKSRGEAALSPYAVFFGSGPWFKYIVDYLLLSPFTTLMAIGYFGYRLLARRFEWKIVYFSVFFLVFFLLLSNVKFTKDVRYVMIFEMVFYLFSIFFLFNVTKGKQKYVLNIIILICFINYFNFIKLFYVNNIYDPVSYHLLWSKEFIPPPSFR
jgi:4-amino-4-deoxy-L-arabinose transferase-like glycosyltransferase